MASSCRDAPQEDHGTTGYNASEATTYTNESSHLVSSLGSLVLFQL